MIKWWDNFKNGLVTLWPKENDAMLPQSAQVLKYDDMYLYSSYGNTALREFVEDIEARIEECLQEIDVCIHNLQLVADGKVEVVDY